MSLVIDASVFVAASRREDVFYAASRQFLGQVRRSEEAVRCPVLILPECAGSIVRATDDEGLANAVVTLIERFPRMDLVVVSLSLGRRAAELAARCRLRGADSCYAAVAEESGAGLVTWDRQMLERCGAVVRVMTPAQWVGDTGA
jgi:predicted nucleic acid-binding protein